MRRAADPPRLAERESDRTLVFFLRPRLARGDISTSTILPATSPAGTARVELGRSTARRLAGVRAAWGTGGGDTATWLFSDGDDAGGACTCTWQARAADVGVRCATTARRTMHGATDVVAGLGEGSPGLAALGDLLVDTQGPTVDGGPLAPILLRLLRHAEQRAGFTELLGARVHERLLAVFVESSGAGHADGGGGRGVVVAAGPIRLCEAANEARKVGPHLRPAAHEVSTTVMRRVSSRPHGHTHPACRVVQGGG